MAARGRGAPCSNTAKRRLPLLLAWALLVGSACAPDPAPSPATGPPLRKPKTLLQEARALGQEGRHEEAIALLLEHETHHPRTLGVRFTVGTLLLESARAAEAIPHFERELELKPDHVASWGMLGSAFERCGNFERAVECFEQQARLNQDDWQAPYRCAVVLRKYLARLDEAVLKLEEARRRNPRVADPVVELGRVWMESERSSEAESLLRELLTTHTENPEAHLLLGQILTRAGRAQEGAELLSRFRTLAAERDHLTQLEAAGTARSSCRAGDLHLQKLRWRKALGLYLRAIELDADEPCGHLGAARARTQQGNTNEALRHLERFAALAPGTFELHYERALALARGGRAPEARAAMEAAGRVRAASEYERERLREALQRTRGAQR